MSNLSILSSHLRRTSFLSTCFTHLCKVNSLLRHSLFSATFEHADLTYYGRSARSSLCSQQAGVSGFWCHRLERPAFPRRICAITRGLQTTTKDLSIFPFLPRHYHMTRVLLLPFITTVWTPVVLAIINII